MKKIFNFLFLICILLGVVSCQSEDLLEDNRSTNLSQLEIDKAIIRQLGFDVSTLVDKGDYYLVEGDIGLNKKDLNQYLEESGVSSIEGSTLRQGYKSGKLVSLEKVKNITVRIDESLPTSGVGSDWRAAVPIAINAWNNIAGSCVRFVYTTNLTADITIKRTYSSDNAIAWTWLPWGQKPPEVIYVNSSFDNFATKANTLIHEMGHTVGLLHSHVTPASQGGVLIPGTPEIDNYSIMSYQRDRTLLPGFSQYDIEAIISLYPTPVSIHTDTQFYANCSYHASVTKAQSGSKYKFEIIGGSITRNNDSSIDFKINNFSYDSLATIMLYEDGRLIKTLHIPIKGKGNGNSGGSGGIHPER